MKTITEEWTCPRCGLIGDHDAAEDLLAACKLAEEWIAAARLAGFVLPGRGDAERACLAVITKAEG